MERRCALRVKHRALPCRSGERADESNIPAHWYQGLCRWYSERVLGDIAGEGQVATLVFSSPRLRSHVSVAPLWSCLFHLTAGVCEPLTCYMATKVSA